MRPRHPALACAAVGLAAAAATLAAVVAARELTGHGTSTLRAVFSAVAVVAALACLAAAPGERPSIAWMFAALGFTLAVCAAVALA